MLEQYGSPASAAGVWHTANAASALYDRHCNRCNVIGFVTLLCSVCWIADFFRQAKRLECNGNVGIDLRGQNSMGWTTGRDHYRSDCFYCFWDRQLFKYSLHFIFKEPSICFMQSVHDCIKYYVFFVYVNYGYHPKRYFFPLEGNLVLFILNAIRMIGFRFDRHKIEQH